MTEIGDFLWVSGHFLKVIADLSPNSFVYADEMAGRFEVCSIKSVLQEGGRLALASFGIRIPYESISFRGGDILAEVILKGIACGIFQENVIQLLL